jgi:serine/threonine protein phosphatase PrpC
MNITTASLSARACNQDHLSEIPGSRAACFVVCDGIAGAPGGEVAAKIACASIVSHFEAESHLNLRHVRQEVNKANQAIRAGQKASPVYARMGTTLVSLFIDRDDPLAYCAHAGDSRLYLFRRGWLRHVTTDHSLVQQMKNTGHDTDDINSNLFYFALGMSDNSREASYSYLKPVKDGEAFLLCTDGFWHSLSEAHCI